MSIAAKHAYRFGYLKSEQWQNVRAAVLARDNAKCWVCKIRNLSNDVHHCQYPENIWDTTPLHCVTLCRECHEKVHDLHTGVVCWSRMKKLLIQIKHSRRIDISNKPEHLRERLVDSLRGTIRNIRRRHARLSALRFGEFFFDNGIIIGYTSH